MELISQFERVRDIDLIYDFAKTISGKRVLEIGCGRGERTHLFVRAGCNVTAIDIVDRRKPALTSGYDFVIADGKDLPFTDKTFDALVSFDVIEHIDEDEIFLRESFRVLKKGGLLVIGTPNRDRLSHKLRQFMGKKIVYPLKIGEGCIHLREYTMNELAELVKNIGFKITKKKYVWFGLIGFVGFKKFPVFLNKWVHYLLVFAIKP